MTEITDEQRAAWGRLSARVGAAIKPGVTVEQDAALIATLLPSELTNPQPVLPTEPGVYVDAHGNVVIHKTTRWRCDGAYVQPGSLPLPLTRLVPERPQITREQVEAPLDDDDLDWAGTVDALLAIANGDNR